LTLGDKKLNSTRIAAVVLVVAGVDAITIGGDLLLLAARKS